jgi:glycosyltransferase involved in cell wall biosynthesis
MERTDHITIGSEYAKGRTIALYGIPPEKITVIPHGMVIPTWLPLVNTEPPTLNEHPVILAVGKMYPRKRFDVLLRAMALLRESLPNVELRLVGNGLEWDRLQALAAELKLQQHVTWLSHLENDAAFAREWRQADVFCHPSSQETFGYVYLEAMTVGKPIVAACAGAAPEVLGDTALLVEPENPAALADGLHAMLTNPALRESYATQAQVRAQQFTLERMVNGYDEIIKQLISH